MSETATAPKHKRGLAPTIRRLKDKYPEMSHSAIARRVGCDQSNVSRIVRAYLKGVTHEDLQDFQSNKADIVDAVSHRVLSSVTDKKIAKMSAQSAVTAFAILTDKSQLLRGLATGINVSVLMDVAEAIRARSEARPHGVSESAAPTLDAKR